MESSAGTTPNQQRRRLVSNPFARGNGGSGSCGRESIYNWAKPSTTLALLIGAGWLSLILISPWSSDDGGGMSSGVGGATKAMRGGVRFCGHSCKY